MDKNKNIIIIRHFETFKDENNNERIYYNESSRKLKKYLEFIEKYINNNSNANNSQKINKIKIFTSNYDRTIITSLIICNGLKSEIISNRLKSIEIFEPVITDILDRDPHKKKHKEICKKITNDINNKLNEDTLYLFITHSSLICNIFNCFCKLYSNEYKKVSKSHIHRYSLSYIKKTKKICEYDFNINMK